eukprot:9390509-Prorocentrum_lima.AAC.1
MRDQLASDLAIVDSKIPDVQEIEERLKKVDISLEENRKTTKKVKGELRAAVEQLDQLGQNLEDHPDQP